MCPLELRTYVRGGYTNESHYAARSPATFDPRSAPSAAIELTFVLNRGKFRLEEDHELADIEMSTDLEASSYSNTGESSIHDQDENLPNP